MRNGKLKPEYLPKLEKVNEKLKVIKSRAYDEARRIENLLKIDMDLGRICDYEMELVLEFYVRGAGDPYKRISHRLKNFEEFIQYDIEDFADFGYMPEHPMKDWLLSYWFHELYDHCYGDDDSHPTWKQIASTKYIWWDIVVRHQNVIGLFTPRKYPRTASAIK